MTKMGIRAAACCLAAVLLAGAASADSWDGRAAALETAYVTAPASGTAETANMEAGTLVREGDSAGSIRAEKVFAPCDGTVAVLKAAEGDTADGEVLEIAPVSLYTVSCTVAGAAETPENALIHIGETVYIRCLADRSHHAEAVIISVSGAEWTAETTAGQLYVGEAVYLYRNPDCKAVSRIGKGTVTAREPLTVSAAGVIRQLRVRAGDRVERGQWLFSVSSSAENEITIPASGIVTKVNVSAGEQVTEGQELAEIAVSCAIRIQVPADEAGLFREGSEWGYIRGDDPHEEVRPCRVSRVLADAENAGAAVELVPEDETLLPVGMGVRVTDVY